MSYRLDMQFDLLDNLVAGKLIALGFREGASLEEGPVVIPAHLFPRGGNDTADLDWRMSKLRSAGFSFTRIRVTKRQAGARRRKRTSASNSEQTSLPLASSIASSPRPAVLEQPKKMGRPPVGEQLRAVVRSLVGSGELKGNSRKEQIEIVEPPHALRILSCSRLRTDPHETRFSGRFAPKGCSGNANDQSEKSRKSKKSFGLHLTPTTCASQR
jgi:hypothetical protein